MDGALITSFIPVLVTGIQQRRVGGAGDPLQSANQASRLAPPAVPTHGCWISV